MSYRSTHETRQTLCRFHLTHTGYREHIHPPGSRSAPFDFRNSIPATFGCFIQNQTGPAHSYESVGQAGCFTYPDNTTLLPCTDQFATDLAGLDWRIGVNADTGTQAAFSIVLPVFTAYKRYKDCLKTAYPGAENAPR